MSSMKLLISREEEIMPTATEFRSPDVAREMTKLFGNRVKKVTIDMKYTRPVRSFVGKIEKAHKQAAKGDLTFC